ncbi:MAG: type II toxin-antitoxin system prevent-host-death family antitoxin, partial [Proteobacteria bacterium]|nr:type II toxin-antitoxin system prevent-host-death family antitoxin [Pseudomonadota bacterium]
MHAIDVTQAQQHLSRVDRTDSSVEDEVVITKGGAPIVKLVDVSKLKKQRQFGTARGLIKIS